MDLPLAGTDSRLTTWLFSGPTHDGGGGPGGGTRAVPKRGLLTDDELQEIEDTYSDGITAVEVVDIFVARGVRFSEATFRKYVQQGLLPRSRRVGRKGKHRGSLGVYPAKTVRRINAIKRLMSEGYTIEEIYDQFLRFTDALEMLEDAFAQILGDLEARSEQVTGTAKDKRTWKRELADAQKSARELLSNIESLSRRITVPDSDRYRGPGAAGNAEDLL